MKRIVKNPEWEKARFEEGFIFQAGADEIRKAIASQPSRRFNERDAQGNPIWIDPYITTDI